MRQDPARGAYTAARDVDQATAQRQGASAPIRVPRWAYPLVTVAALLLGAEAIVRGTRLLNVPADSDLTNFFFPSADYILHGHPFQMYAVRGSGLYPNFNPPLGTFLMAPLLAAARAVGFGTGLGAPITFVSFGFLIFVPLLGHLVVRALGRLYPAMPDTQRFLAYVLIVLSPLTWQAFSPWYHLEQPLMLCFLVGALIALQSRRAALAGLLAGLALLTRTTALMPVLALGVLLLAERDWRTLVRFGGIAALVVVAGFAPFFVFDSKDATYSFLTWRGTAPIGGNSIWALFAAPDNATGLRHTLDAAARRLDQPAAILCVLAVSALAALRLRVSASSREAWAVLALAALAVPMLSKTVWPYYYLEPFVLLLVWEFSSMHDRVSGVWRWPVLSFSYLAVAATLSQFIGVQSVGALDRIGLGVLELAAMAAFAAAIWARMRAAKPDVAQQPAATSPSAGVPGMHAAFPAGAGPQGPSSSGAMAFGLVSGSAGAPAGPFPGTPPRAPQAGPAPGAPWAAERAPASPAAAQAQGQIPPGGLAPHAPQGAAGDAPRPGRPPLPAEDQWPDLDAGWPSRSPAMGDR